MNKNKIVWSVACSLLSLSLLFAIPAGAQSLTQIPTITTLADTGGGLPAGIVADTSGNVYVVDQSANVVKKVNSAGVVTIFAGGGAGLDNTPAASAALGFPQGIAIDGAGNLYIADTNNHVVRVINTQASPITVFGVTIAGGNIRTVAGTFGTGGYSATTLERPNAVALDSAGNMY